MKIVHVITRFIRGGADENTQLTCNMQARAGHDVVLVVGREWETSMREGLHSSVRMIVVPNLVRKIAPARDVIGLIHLFRLFAKLRPDIVHTHTSKAGFLGRAAAALVGVPQIVHGVHILPFSNMPPLAAFFYVWLERACGFYTHAFVHVSSSLRDECLRHHVGRSALHVVAESGMDVARYRNASPPGDASSLLQSPVGKGRPFVVLSIAVLEPRKGQRKFLKVFKRIISERPNTLLLFAGEGVERNSLEHEIRKLGLTSHVRLLGYRNDTEKLLAIADCVAICSEREGLPRVAVQAAIARVPIVTTALPGIEIVVSHGESGFIVPVDGLEDMEPAIVGLIDRPDIRARAREMLAANDYSPWDADAMGAKIDRVYAQLQQGRSSCKLLEIT